MTQATYVLMVAAIAELVPAPVEIKVGMLITILLLRICNQGYLCNWGWKFNIMCQQTLGYDWHNIATVM